MEEVDIVVVVAVVVEMLWGLAQNMFAVVEVAACARVKRLAVVD